MPPGADYIGQHSQLCEHKRTGSKSDFTQNGESPSPSHAILGESRFPPLLEVVKYSCFVRSVSHLT